MTIKESSWKGLDPETLAKLEMRLCRIHNRQKMFGGSDPQVQSRGPASMIGLLVLKAHELAKGIYGSQVVRRSEIGESIGIRHLSDFSRFLAGQQSGARWLELGRSALSFLLTGSTKFADQTLADSDAARIAQRIDDYFFRGLDSATPSFFDSKRVTSDDAWTSSELAGEIRWLARSSAEEPRSAKYQLWYVSGSSHLTIDLMERKVIAAAMMDCVKKHILVSIVCPTAHPGLGSLRDAGFSLIDTDVLLPESPSFITPCLSFLHLTDGYEKMLWIIREQSQDEIKVPLALRGTRTEVEAFRQWLNSNEIMGKSAAPRGQP